MHQFTFLWYLQFGIACHTVFKLAVNDEITAYLWYVNRVPEQATSEDSLVKMCWQLWLVLSTEHGIGLYVVMLEDLDNQCRTWKQNQTSRTKVHQDPKHWYKALYSNSQRLSTMRRLWPSFLDTGSYHVVRCSRWHLTVLDLQTSFQITSPNHTWKPSVKLDLRIWLGLVSSIAKIL